MHAHDVAPKQNPDTEPTSPQDTADYVKAGPGTWQPLGLVIQRVISRLSAVDGGGSTS